MKGNVASRVTWDQEGRYVTQKWESRVLRSTSLGGNESLSVWPDQGWGMGAPLWAPEFLLWTLRLFPGLVCCLLFCKQRCRASSSLPSPSDGGYLFLVTSLRIPGGWPQGPGGACVPSRRQCSLPGRARGGSRKVGNCGGRSGRRTSLHRPLQAPHPCTRLTPLLEKLQSHGA